MKRPKRITLNRSLIAVIGFVIGCAWFISYFGIQYVELEVFRKGVALYSFRGSLFLEERPASGELFSARYESYSVTGTFKGLLEETYLGFRLSRLRSGLLVIGIPYWFVAGCAIGIFLSVRRRRARRERRPPAGGFEVQASIPPGGAPRSRQGSQPTSSNTNAGERKATP